MPAKFDHNLETKGKSRSDLTKKTPLELAHEGQENAAAEIDTEVSMNAESAKDESVNNESVKDRTLGNESTSCENNDSSGLSSMPDNKDATKGGKGRGKGKSKVSIFAAGYFS